jgi:Flp pilus assembly protein TadD/thiol-disulfide isomerase/thioredoxin
MTAGSGASSEAIIHLLREGRSFSGRERNCCFLNLGDGRFADISAASGFDFPDDGRAVARVDWDQDGDLDLWIVNRNGPQLRLLRNDVPSGHHWLALRLVGNGTTSNRDAIGARVEVITKDDGPQTTDHRPHLRTLRAGEGFLSQSSKWLHFGLGSSDALEGVTVRWPDGTTEEFAGMVADERYRIVQGSGKTEPWQGPSRMPSALRPEPLAGSPTTQTARLISVGALPLPSIEYETFTGRWRPVAPSNRPVAPSDKDEPAAVLLNLWASWCAPCLHELGEFTAAEDRIRAAGIDIVALSVDGLAGQQGSSAETAQQLIAKIGFPFRSGTADSSALEKLQLVHDQLFDVHWPLAVPTSILLDAQGRILALYRGPVSVDRLVSDVEQRPSDFVQLIHDAVPFPGRWLSHGGHLSPYRLAWNLLDRGYLDDGRRYIEQHAQLFDGNIELSKLRFKLADEQLKLGEVPAAKQNMRAGLQLNPNDAEASHNLGVLLQSEGRHGDAIRQFRQALERGADPFYTHSNLGRSYLAQDQRELAIDHFRRALKLNPDDSRALGNLARALAMVRKLDEATVHFRRIVQLNPDDIRALSDLARALAMGGNFKEATIHLRQVLQLQPDDAAAHAYLGAALISQDDLEEAIRHLRRAVELKPDFATAHQYLVTALKKAGQVEEANQHLGP